MSWEFLLLVYMLFCVAGQWAYMSFSKADRSLSNGDLAQELFLAPVYVIGFVVELVSLLLGMDDDPSYGDWLWVPVMFVHTIVVLLWIGAGYALYQSLQ